MTNDKFIVTGLFNDRESAECAYKTLEQYGYNKDDADVMMSNETRDRYYSADSGGDTELGTKALEGTGTGAAIGGTIGATIAAIAAVGTNVLLPGLGLIVAGPLAAASVGAGAGGLTGGLIGALIGSGIPEERAEAYESGIKSGGIVLRVSPRSAEDASIIEGRWRQCGGEEIYSNASGRSSTDAASQSTDADRQSNDDNDKMVIPVIEEELQVGKRTVETGGVRVKTSISERPVEETVTLRDETLNVDRHPVNRSVTDADISAIKEGEVTIMETDEQAVAAKQPRVVEEVVIGKDVTEREETVRGSVRATEVDVAELPDKNREEAKRAAK